MWERCVPTGIQNAVRDRIVQRVQSSPWEAGTYESLAAKLELAQFSDYPKIIKANWVLFEDAFGLEAAFDQHMRTVTNARNAFKHNRELNLSELALAEGGLLWLEGCLENARAFDDAAGEEDEVPDEEAAAVG